MLDRSWLGAALKNYDQDPKSWNDVWPNSNKSVWPNSNKSSTPESSVQSSTAIYFEPGGVIKGHIERWQELARSGADVEILVRVIQPAH